MYPNPVTKKQFTVNVVLYGCLWLPVIILFARA
jgi:hypothetical protein